MKPVSVFAALFLSLLSAFASPEEQIAKALAGPLKGYQFNKRLAAPTMSEHVLLFSKDNFKENRLVVWTENSGDRFAAIPTSPMSFKVVNAEGNEIETVETKTFSLIIKLDRQPHILIPERENDYLMLAAAATRVKSPIRVKGPRTVDLSCVFFNPLDQDILFTVEKPSSKVVMKPGGRYTVKKSVSIGRPWEPVIVPMEGNGIVQQVLVQVENPLRVSIWPEFSRSITLRLENPAGSPFRGEGEINLISADGEAFEPFRFDIAMTAGQREKSISIPLNFDGILPYPASVSIKQRSRLELGKVFLLTETLPTQFSPLPPFVSDDPASKPIGYEGRSQGKSYWQFTAGKPAEGIPNESTGTGILVYSFQAGGIGIKIRPELGEGQSIIAKPTSYGVWVFSDQSLNFVTCGIRDATGRIFQPTPILLDWKGWRYLRFKWPLEMQAPLHWDSIIEIIYDKAAGSQNGAIYVNNPALVYEFSPVIQVAPVEVAPEAPVTIDRQVGAPIEIPLSSITKE